MADELTSFQLIEINKKLDAILVQVKATNGRVDRAEDDIIRLQERTNPWAAGGVVSGLGLVAYAVWERLSK